MARFWRTWAFACMMGLGGCSGRNIEGQWFGAVPGFGQDCRIRLDGGSRLSAVCTDGPQRAGLARYHLEGHILTVEWQTVRENGRTVELPRSFLTLRVEGPGNQMTLTPTVGGTPFAWERRG